MIHNTFTGRSGPGGQRRIGVLLAAILIAAAQPTAAQTPAAPAQPEPPPSASASITFEEIASRVDASFVVRTAEAQARSSAAEVIETRYPGAPRLQVTPGVDLTGTTDGTAGTRIDLSAALSVTVPYGLSSTAQLGSDAALRRADLADAAYAEARALAYAELIELYQTAWLAQEETAVLVAERDAAIERLRAVDELFARGDVSVVLLNEREDAVAATESALIEGTLAQRIAWLELAYAVGIDEQVPSGVATRTVSEADRTPQLSRLSSSATPAPRLEPLSLPSLATLPRPPELTDWAWHNSAAVRAQLDRIASLEASRAALAGTVLSPVVRVGLSGWNQSAALSVNTATATADFSYQPPALSIGTPPSTGTSGSSTADSWRVSLAVTVPLQGTGASDRTRDLQSAEIAQAELQLEALRETLSLQVRSGFQQQVVASEREAAAAAALGAAERSLATVLARRPEQRATLSDELDARAQVARAEYRLAVAQATELSARLRLASLAGWLPNMIGTIPEVGIDRPTTR